MLLLFFKHNLIFYSRWHNCAWVLHFVIWIIVSAFDFFVYFMFFHFRITTIIHVEIQHIKFIFFYLWTDLKLLSFPFNYILPNTTYLLTILHSSVYVEWGDKFIKSILKLHCYQNQYIYPKFSVDMILMVNPSFTTCKYPDNYLLFITVYIW